MVVPPLQNGHLARVLPNWFAPLPTKVEKGKNWCEVVVCKKTSEGERITDHAGNPLFFRFHVDCLTGNLYEILPPLNKKELSQSTISRLPFCISIKAFFLLCGIFPYSAGLVSFHLLKIALLVYSLLWRVASPLFKDLPLKGTFSSLSSREIFSEISCSLWQISRTPFYAVKMSVAALFTFFFPLEGRKWLGNIEFEWHQKTSYVFDIRRKNTQTLPFFSKVYYLGYCMQIKGSIHTYPKLGSKLGFLPLPNHGNY